jgi:hypothetical protein
MAMRSVVVIALIGALGAAAGAPAVAARGGSRVIRYLGARLVVPAGWPVFDLSRAPATCVRFDRHAVYLGLPSARQLCPPHVAGRTEAILVEPSGSVAARDLSLSGGALAPVVAGAPRAAGDELVRTIGRVTVVATWAGAPQLIQRALGLSARLVPAYATLPMHASIARSSPTGGGSAGSGAPTPGTPTPSTPTAGQVYTGYGFDACSAPSEAELSAWSVSPFRAVGVYIGGANMACTQTNLTSTWVSDEAAAGWHMIPIYVGLQAPGNSCGCAAFTLAQAAGDGTAAALDAVSHAQALGLGTGNPIYLDLEAYTRTSRATQAALDFVGAWTAQLHASGYLSGVYSSDGSGIADLVSQYGTGFAEPDDLWFASWNGQANTTDSTVPSSEWASHQRLHQYRGGHVDDYGGTSLDIDSDYVDALTAGPGMTTPSLSVAPAADGSIALRPAWRGGPAVSSWQLLAGASPNGLTPAARPASASSSAPLVVHSSFRYFAVTALGADGSALATSPPVPTPAHLALAGSSVFVPTAGLGGLPVSCFDSVPCHVATTISIGRRRLVTTGTEYVPVGGGLVFFNLAPSWRRQLFAAPHHRLAVTVTLRDASGLAASHTMNLTGFTTSGRAPSRSTTPSPSVQVVGLTDYVSHGWVGGILTSCAAEVPCHIALTLSSGRTVLARTGSEYLGAHELGYMVFSLTAAAHATLARAAGNQLGVQVSAVNGSDRASAHVVLVAFG